MHRPRLTVMLEKLELSSLSLIFKAKNLGQYLDQSFRKVSHLAAETLVSFM